MPHTDWLPHKEQDFMDLCQKWVTLIEKDESLFAYNWNQTECTGLLNKIKTFLAARAAYEADDSSKNRVIKDESKEEARDAMRDFANSSVRFNKRMTGADRLLLGIKAKDTTPAQQPIPASQPETVVENTKNHYEHKLIGLNPDGKTAHKPASGEDLPKSHFSRKTDHTVTYTEAAKGKPAYYATRYENGKGEGGPWSPIVEAYIG